MTEEVAASAQPDKGVSLRMVLGVVVAAALAAFVLQNTDDAQVKFLWMDGKMPMFLLLLVTVVLTAVLTLLVSWMLRRRSD